MLVRSLQTLSVLTLATLIFGSVPYASAIAREQCITIGQKKVCFDDGKKKKGNDDDDNGGGQKPKPTGNKCQGEIACPAGYVVLDKPNKYGACCEPKQGLPEPKKEQPKQAEKCKYGMTGTPPDCSCPYGSVFHGYKGCLKTCCGTPQPGGGQQFVQCHANGQTALKNAIALAKANSDPGNRVTCNLTDNFPPSN